MMIRPTVTYKSTCTQIGEGGENVTSEKVNLEM
jgi:hypothetical protein